MDRLWNDLGADDYGSDALYRSAILEQYKLYVEMADRISQRRALANTFFLTLNAAVFAAIGSSNVTLPKSTWQLAFACAGMLLQCGAWYFQLRSYRQLNTAKFKVIGELEQRLPASPYWLAEWQALGEGKDRRLYWPLSHVETWIPALFAAGYVGVFVAAIAS